jgi:hypothetical protein
VLQLGADLIVGARVEASGTSAGAASVSGILISTTSSSGPTISLISAAVADREICFIEPRLRCAEAP